MLSTIKLSLEFPDYNSLWLFKAKTKAINVRVEPRKNIITGLFETAEIEMAVKEFNAVQPTLSFPGLPGGPGIIKEPSLFF